LQDNPAFLHFIYAEFNGIQVTVRSMSSIIGPKRQHPALVAGADVVSSDLNLPLGQSPLATNG